MKLKQSLLSLFILLFALTAQSQMPESPYLQSIEDLLNTFSEKQKTECSFEFDDPHRTQWSRFPGERKGLKLTAFDEKQKIAFHRLLRAFFPSQGYLKITSIMFNEDIQKKNEPELGKNEYWFSYFGDAAKDKNWGWKLEGHHLSINMTLKGNEVISFTPTILASNPAVANSDGERDGLAILFNEEELARQLLHSFSKDQLAEAYTDREKPTMPDGESNEVLKDIPKEGILISKLTKTQRSILDKLVTEYIQNFNASDVPTLDEILNEDARFFFIGHKVHGKPHYYRIENGKHFIEYENYANHIHLLWRSYDDYGK